MKKNKVWVAMLIMGVCFIITGLGQMYWHNYFLSAWQVIMGIVEIILALVQKEKREFIIEMGGKIYASNRPGRKQASWIY